MTPEEQRIAIAEACGWKWITPSLLCGYDPRRKQYLSTDIPTDGSLPFDSLPNYLNDLNAMSEAENIFNADASQRYDYAQLLEGICAQDRSESEYGRPIWKATAGQRAEALLKTLNLWKP